MENSFTREDLEAFWSHQPVSQTPDLCYPISAEPEELHQFKNSSSEWAFDRFIQETGTCSPLSCSSVIGDRFLEDLSIAIPDTSMVKSGTLDKGDAMNKSSIPFRPSFVDTADSDCYTSYTTTQLNRDFAETASLTSTKNPLPLPPSTEKDSETSKHFKSDILTSGDGFSIVQPVTDGKPTGTAAVPSLHKKPTTHGQTTSESSRDPSDDEDGDTEVTENINPSDDKRARRMQSNRESARRSRRRKQDHLNELEKQVEQLKFENTNLSNRLSHVNQKYQDASVDNRVLRANIETLRTKVKMAEDTVKRATGTYNPLLQPMSASGEGSPPLMAHLSNLSDPCMVKPMAQPVNLMPSHGQPVGLHRGPPPAD